VARGGPPAKVGEDLLDDLRLLDENVLKVDHPFVIP
jgi:hypothetical protein